MEEIKKEQDLALFQLGIAVARTEQLKKKILELAIEAGDLPPPPEPTPDPAP